MPLCQTLKVTSKTPNISCWTEIAFSPSHLAPLALPHSSGSPLTWNQWLESVTQVVQFMGASSGINMMHLFLNWPMYTWSANRANTIRQNTVRVITSASCFTEWRRALMIVFRPASKKRGDWYWQLTQKITRHDGHCFESSENPECPETRQVAHVNEGSQVAGADHKEVQPVPRVSQISVIVQNESFS